MILKIESSNTFGWVFIDNIKKLHTSRIFKDRDMPIGTGIDMYLAQSESSKTEKVYKTFLSLRLTSINMGVVNLFNVMIEAGVSAYLLNDAGTTIERIN